ncbi:MAG: hypothetical protein Q8R72_12025 [Hylemonella sp.]|nr:hypothetical protein [Hylemonella sp.]
MKQRYKIILAFSIAALATYLVTITYAKKSETPRALALAYKVSTEMNSFNDVGRIEAYDFLENLIKRGCNKEALDFINYQRTSMLADLQSHMKESATIRNTVMDRNEKIGERADKAVPRSGSYTYPSCK